MARLKSTIQSDMDMSGNKGDGTQYRLTPPDFYNAVVQKIEFKTYSGKSGDLINPDSTDGKWTYAKLIPHYLLLNDNNTLINRQDYVMGVMNDEGEIFRPDGNPDKMAIWASDNGAFFLLTAMGLLEKTGEKQYEFDHDTDHILDRYLRIRTGIAGYIKGKRINFDHKQITTIFTELYGSSSYTFDDIPALNLLYNVQNGYSSIEFDGVEADDSGLITCQDALNDTDGYEIKHQDSRLKLKNAVIGISNLNADDTAELNGFYADEGVDEKQTVPVFTGEGAFDHWVSLINGTSGSGW